MWKSRFVIVVVWAIALAGCTNEGGNSPSGPAGTSGHAAGRPISPDQQLDSSTQLQSDLDALTAAPTVGDLQNAVTQLQNHYKAVAGSAVTNDAADWQQAINNLQQTLTDVSQLVEANSSTPDAPNPLNSSGSGNQSTTGAPSPAKPAKPGQSPTEIINEVKEAAGLLGGVIKKISFAVIINNSGPGTVSNSNGGTHPKIDCGPAKTKCKGYVLATSTVSFDFRPPNNGSKYWIDAIESVPQWSCNPNYSEGKKPSPLANCSVSATAGNTVTITPNWVPSQWKTPAPPTR
jgi:uncharacterized protein YukE